MKILVTGGAGFIGSHLTKKLYEQGHEVVVIDNLNDYYSPQLKRDRLEKMLDKERYVFLKTDITNKEELETVFASFDFDAVCHIAAYAGLGYSMLYPQTFYLNNIFGTENIINLVDKYKVKKVIQASSSSVYGDTKHLPYTEDVPTGNQLNPYAASKRVNELTLYTHQKAHGYSAVVFRFFNVYGTWARPDLVFSKFLDLMKAGKPINIHNYGKMQRGFTYIDDVVGGIISALNKNLDFEIINLGNDDTEMLDDVVNTLEEILGIKAIKNYLPLPEGEVPATCPNIDKAKRLLNYEPSTKFEDGIRKLIDWYHDYYKSN